MSSLKKALQLSIPVTDEDQLENASDWKDVIFVPFHPVWSILILFSVLVNATVSVYSLSYQNTETQVSNIIYHICEIFYFADIILLIMHRHFPQIRKRRSFKYKGLGFIAINVASMIPLYELTHYLSIPDIHVEADASRNYLKLKCIIRLYRIIEYTNEQTNRPGLNIIAILTLAYLAKLFIAGHFMAAILYIRTINDTRSWIKNLHKHKFDRSQPFQWYTIMFTLMTGNLLHNFPSGIKPETNQDMIFYIFTLLLGFTLHMMIFVSHLIATFKKDHMNYFEYETQVAKIMGLLDEWDADEDLKKKTLDYYSVFWQKRSGLRDMPEMFNLLPTALKKEVTVDIFWEALRHSHFFVGTGMSFKRSVSLVMKSEFLLPGDFLFRIDELKTKMVYIVSGVVQILSSEDDDSPIMSFSSGTLLGETGCLIATSSPANLRTATYCEIQALYLTDLYKVLLNFPVIAKYIKQQLSNRISTARHNLDKYKSSDDLGKETTIKAVREFWNEIWRSNAKKNSSKGYMFTDRIRAENLDLLALSDEVELRVDSICLSGQCPFVLDPDTIFRRFCDVVVVFAVLVQIFLIPQAAFFYNRMTDGEMSILFLMDVIYLFDIYLQISTAVKSNDGLISDVRKILVIRLKQINFLVDVVATIPFDYIAIFIGNGKLASYYKLLRLLKIYKIIYIFKFFENLYMVDTNVICIIKYIFMYVCSIYWLTCVMSGVSTLDKTNTSWFDYNVGLYNLSISSYYKFHISLLMTITAYMNYGPTGYDVYSFHDTWFYFFIVVCGHLLFSYGFSELTAGVVLKHDDERTNRTYLYTLKREASQYKIASDVHSRVLSFLNFHYTVRAGCQIFGEEGIFENAPLELRNEIVRHRIIHCLKKVPLFADASDDLLRYIVAHSEMKLVPPNSVILKAENKSDLLYVLMRGYCMMQSSLPGDLERGATAVLQSGSTFPFLETFHGAFSFLSVTTITVAELLLIRTDIIMNAFQTYEADYGSFRDALKDHKQVYGSILFRKGARLPLLTSVEKAKKKGRVFEYDVHDIDDVQYNERAYRQPFLRLGAWSFLRFLLLRKTINPDSWFYVCWEVFRCIVGVVYVFCAITMSTLIGHTMRLWGKALLFMVLNFYCWIDLYVRMHCQFYNRKGILVRHPLTTARHYIRTSFTVDLISAIPIRILQLDQLLGNRHQTHVMICLMLFTKLLHLHRPWSGLTYLEKKYKGKKGLAVHMIKYLLVIIIAIAFCQTLVMLVVCKAHAEKLYCEEREEKQRYQYSKYFIEYFYKVSTFFTISTTGILITTFRQGVLFVLILIPMYILRWIFMITTTSKAIGGNVELTLYRDRMKSYMEFLEGAFVSEKDIQAIVAHYEYVWKKSQGMNMHHVLKYFHPQLEQDMAYSLYSNTLLRATLFQGEHPSVFEALTPLFYREYYTKDSMIIQCNDIQKKIFFVHEGSVDIYIANTLVCILESGGMFGCLQKTGITRQTLTAVTKIHSTVLTVDSTLLHRTLQSFPKVYERLSRLILLNYEYLKETKESAKGVASQKTEVISNGLYDQYKPFFDSIYIMEDGFGYSALSYLVCVHIYPLGANFILGATFINLHNQHPQWVLWFMYLLDLFHLSVICLKFNKIYLDPGSGSLIKDPYIIRKNYAKTTFWLDFLTVLPLDLMSFTFTTNVFIHNICRLNKTFRFIFLVIYYYHCEERLSMKKHLKWTYMIYSNLFLVQLFACLWLLIACPGTKCYFNDARVTMSSFNVSQNDDVLSSTLVAYLFVVNMYTGAGIIKTSPIKPTEIILTCVIALFTQYVITNLCSAYASMVLIDKYNFSKYEVRFTRLATYLQGQKLSPSLYSKVAHYCLRLWQCQRGDWLPEMIQESPSSLKENIMNGLYGKNLTNHFLFQATHKDFLRQLVVHLERFVFSPGDSIVEKGDSDCCMYFISSGEVNVYEVEGKAETKMLLLDSGMSFGEAQGLYCVSHHYSYRACTVCDILILNKNRWEYLLKWFPASREEIYSKAQLNGLHRVVDETEIF